MDRQAPNDQRINVHQLAPMATPEAFLTALYPLLPLVSTSESARSLSDKVNGQVGLAVNALAAICVANGTSDVVAVALDARADGTKLYIATNGEVKPPVVKHLISVWSCLGRIAKLANGRNSTTSSSDIDAYRTNIILQIYGFSRKKFRHEFQKHSEGFLGAFPQAHTSTVRNPPFDRDQYEELGYIKSTFEKITEMVRREDPTDDQVLSLAGLVDELGKKLQCHLDETQDDSFLDRLHVHGACIRHLTISSMLTHFLQ